ncbi:NAD-dependent epimerase/dehydratase family protein [Rubripirellula reticaptiva]|uniref:UDP-glucose 4-epimerase n=1 Tax=Rubripirellula reticaptiva TaxID=2528013 RepID=A0A5C6F335_9BACT|nr:NAD-dependent epimerase/dehydratase family protein [Rubripirellula reticaptiva]TWU55728.1 UDP-glucose 4-epimerase [Rubripirellula reticaptiva]
MTESTTTVLVTGAAGFIGSHIVRGILEDKRYEDFKIIAFDDLSGGFKDNLPVHERVSFIHGDVSNVDDVAGLFSNQQIRYVFHLAAYAAEGLSHFIRRFNYRNNLIGSVNLINESVNAGVQHFVFTSSIAVYGKGQVPMTEATNPHPEDPYGIAKLAVELDLKSAADMFGLKSTVFRPHNVYGEYQNIGDRYRNVVGIFINRMMQGLPLPVFGDGSQQRAFTYIADIITPMLSAPFIKEAEGEVFNIGASAPVSVRELANVVAQEFKGKPDIEFLPARNEVHLAYSDHSKADRVFGKSEETPLVIGIRQMADWAKQAGDRTSATFENIEIDQGLPPSWRSHHGK